MRKGEGRGFAAIRTGEQGKLTGRIVAAKPPQTVKSAMTTRRTDTENTATKQRKRRATRARRKQVSERACRKMGRPTYYNVGIAKNLCRLIASGMTTKDACTELGIPERTFFFWVVVHADFLQSYARARDIRANVAFWEQQLEIAENPRKTGATTRGAGSCR